MNRSGLQNSENEEPVHYQQGGSSFVLNQEPVHYSHSGLYGFPNGQSGYYTQSGLYNPNNDESVRFSQNELPYTGTEESFSDELSASKLSGHWKASLNPPEGLEGYTPYLSQQQFDKAEDVLHEDNENVDNELIFDTCRQAYDWRSRTRTFDPQSSADPTIPRTPEQTKAAVKLVFKAYKSVALATDNAGMLKAFQDQKHDNRHVETICWTIVEGCIDRCDRGPLLNAYEPEKAKNTASIKTFAQRLDAIVEALSRQKTICKHLLDAPYLNRFLDDPVGSRQRVESNRKLNKKKGGVMDVGKKALGMKGKKGRPVSGKKSRAASDDEGEEYGSDNEEYKGESSDISSAFRTPDPRIRHANDSSAPPSIAINPLYSKERFRSETPTPASRRRRAATSSTLSPMRAQTPQTPYLEQYSNTVGADPNVGQGHQSVSMSMLPGSMIDPALGRYNGTLSYGVGQNTGSMSSFEVTSVRASISFNRRGLT
jgi:hypothetical protein